MNAMTASLTAEPFAAMPRPRRHVDLWDLLVWAYRDQLVGGARPDLVLRLGDSCPPRSSTDGVAAMLRWREIGAWVEGGEHKGIGDRVHPDAAAVADAVGEVGAHLGFGVAGLLARAAHAATRPEPCRETPRPVRVPMTGPGSYDPHSGTVRPKVAQPGDSAPGERDADGTVYQAGWWPIGPDARREKGWRYEDTPAGPRVWAPWCPVVYEPEMHFIAERNREHALWLRGMRRLLRLLCGVDLRDHVVTGFRAD